MFGKSRKNKVSDPLPATVEAATAGGPGYPSEYKVASLREHRMLLSLRAVSFGMFVSIILNIVLAFLLVSLFPLKEVRPFLVQLSEEGSVAASIRPIQDTFDAMDLLTEKLVREYVVVRNEILRSDVVMTDRWSGEGIMGTMSSPDEYRRFVERVTPILEEIRQQGGEQRVEIISSNAIRTGQVYVVDFRAKSFDSRDQLIDETIYTATIEIEFRPLKNLTQAQMMINPTGFTVLNHTLAIRNQ